MRVTCERCNTEYRFDDSRVTEAGVRVKCTRCDHVFLVRRKSFVVTEAVPVSAEEREALDQAKKGTDDAPGENEKHRRWLIRRGDGELLEFKEMTTLQRWIVERKVSRSDEISHNGERWKQLGSIPELETFFAVVEATPAALDQPAPPLEDSAPPQASAPPPRSAPADEAADRAPAKATIGRVATVPNPQTPPETIEERTPVPGPLPGGDSAAGPYRYSGTAGEYQPTGSREPVDPSLAEPTTVGGAPPPQRAEQPAGANGQAPADPAWSHAQAPSHEPEPLDTGPAVRRPQKRRGLRVVLLLLLLIVGAGGVFYVVEPEKSQALLTEARARASKLIAQVTFPKEALAAADKGHALLREDAAAAYQEAEAEFRAALSLVKARPFPKAAAGLAESLSLQDLLEGTDKHRAEVARYAEEALAADPTLPAAHRAQAYLALLKKDYEAADAAVVQALARDPRDAEAHTLRATIYIQQGERDEEAIDALQQALTLDPELPRANYLMGHLLLQSGQIPEAKPYASRAAAASPRNERAEALLKQILAGGTAVGSPTETPSPTPTAVAETTQTPTPRPLSVDELVQRGYRAHERGRYQEAKRYYERAIDRAPENSEAYALLGLSCLKSGEYGAAESYLLSARSLNPRYADTYRYLGMLYAARGERDRAVENFEKYLDMRPKGSGADDVRRRLAVLEGHGP